MLQEFRANFPLFVANMRNKESKHFISVASMRVRIRLLTNIAKHSNMNSGGFAHINVIGRNISEKSLVYTLESYDI